MQRLIIGTLFIFSAALITPTNNSLAEGTPETLVWETLKKAEWNEAISIIKANPELSSSRNQRGEMPIHYILWRAPNEISAEYVKLFPNELIEKDDVGHYPIHLALMRYNQELAKIILELKPESAHFTNGRNQYPLHTLAIYSRGAEVDFVELVHRLNPNAVFHKDEDDRTPVECAYRNLIGHDTTIKLAELNNQAVSDSPLSMPELKLLLSDSPQTNTLLDRFSNFEKQTRVDIRISDFRWPLFFKALDQMATRNTNSHLFAHWTPSHQIQALEIFAFTLPDYSLETDADLAVNNAPIKYVTQPILNSYGSFLAKLFAERAAKPTGINTPSIAHVVFLFRRNIEKNDANHPRAQALRDFIKRLSLEPEFKELVPELEKIYATKDHTKITESAVYFLTEALKK
jgi:hypothetical protein